MLLVTRAGVVDLEGITEPIAVSIIALSIDVVVGIARVPVLTLPSDDEIARLIDSDA